MSDMDGFCQFRVFIRKYKIWGKNNAIYSFLLAVYKFSVQFTLNYRHMC
jgi:hypothetical protein